MADRKTQYDVGFIAVQGVMDGRKYSVVDQTESDLFNLLVRREQIANDFKKLENETMKLGWKFDTQNGYFILRELKNPNSVYGYKE